MRQPPDAKVISEQLSKQKAAIEAYQREFKTECKKFIISTAENKTHISIVLAIVFIVIFVIFTIDERMRNRVIPKMDEYAKKHNQQLFDSTQNENEKTLFTMYNDFPISVILVLFTSIALFLSVIKYSKVFLPIQRLISKNTWIVRSIALVAMLCFFNYLIISSMIFGIFYFDLPTYSSASEDDNLFSYLFASSSTESGDLEGEDEKLKKEIADSFFFFGASIITHILIFFILSYIMFVFQFD